MSPTSQICSIRDGTKSEVPVANKLREGSIERPGLGAGRCKTPAKLRKGVSVRPSRAEARACMAPCQAEVRHARYLAELRRGHAWHPT